MRVLSHSALRERGIPYCKSYLWKLERKGAFPKRIQLGPRSVAWLESDIDAWIKDKYETTVFQTNECLKSNR